MKIEESHENIVALSDIREKKLRASSPFGPVRVGLTTLPSPKIIEGEQEVRLMELLNSLESVVERLNYKSFTAYATLQSAFEGVRVALYDSILNTDGTDE